MILTYGVPMNKSQQECGDNMCSWMAYKRPMNDVHEKKKKKKPIGKRELVGLIRDLEKGLET